MPEASPAESSTAIPKLFWACFIALVATSFFFGLRSVVVSDLQGHFNLTGTKIGEVLGVGLWPFAFSIIFFSLVIDKIGYKTSALIAIALHIVAVVGTIIAIDRRSYEWLYWSTFIVALANGIVEAFINPVVATIYSREKTKWLNILHAGWPGGLALGAAVGLLLGYVNTSLTWKFGVCLIPVVFYAFLTIPRTFPIQERVASGVPYREMLRQVGGLGFLVIAWLTVMGVIQVIDARAIDDIAPLLATTIAIAVSIGAWVYTRSPGNLMFFVILLSMPFLATTELGTDTWMTALLEADLGKLAGWVFVMVSIIMTILRFYAGPIIHMFSPIGLLVVSAALAILGLIFLGIVPPSIMVFAAIVYAFGKTFLWSTTLGVVSEQFPRGGALTLNGVSAVGVLGMGILGAPLMGLYLDKGIVADLKQQTAFSGEVVGEPKKGMFGMAPDVKMDAGEELEAEKKETFYRIVNTNKKEAFIRQATLPGVMLLIYLALFFYFRWRGGYEPVTISPGETET